MDDPNPHRLILEHLDLATRLAHGYAARGIELDDLVQVARLGLVKAAGHFDPDRGDFAPYAAATIRGELKRHFRDHGWDLRPPRRLQETVARLSAGLEVEDADRREAEQARQCYTLASIEAATDAGHEQGGLDPGYGHVEDRLTVGRLCRDLPRPDRQLLQWRFADELSQSQIGVLLGVGQTQVSRRLSTLLDHLHLRAQPRAA